MLEILFFICLGGIAHTYIIYPLFILGLGWLNRKKRLYPETKDFPRVEVIFAAYNEEDVIAEKIKSTFNTQYPIEKLSVSIGSDASSDRTDEIITQLQPQFPGLKLQRFEGRTGKAGIINALAEQSEADLLIFTDANILFMPDTISELVRGMNNPKTGITGGHILYKQVREQGISQQENTYLKLENAIKQAESEVFGKAIGVEGGCYIIRRELFPGIPPLFFMEDFYISMSVLERGHQVIFNDKARCIEDVSVQSQEEYKRKIRISIGNFQNLAAFKKLIWKRFFPLGFLFFSHKVLRWLTPFFLLVLIPVSTLLAPWGFFYALFAGFYMLFLGLGMFGILFSQSRWAGWLKYPGHFIHMNLALLEGFFTYIKGVSSNAWEPTRRNQE